MLTWLCGYYCIWDSGNVHYDGVLLCVKNPRYFGLLVFALMALTHAADIVRDDFLFASLLSPTLVWYVIEVALIWFILMYKKQPLIQSLRPTEAIAGIKQKNGT